MKPDRTVRAGPGGPPRKAAYSSQRKLPARPRAAAAAIAVTAEEERRLRQRNRLMLEEDKPAVERCLEELVFGDVEDNEDALLQRLRGPWVREAVARGPGALGGARGRRRSGGGAWATQGAGEHPGGREPENAGSGRARRSGEGGDRAFPRPVGSGSARCPAGAQHVLLSDL